ncbi:MAG: DUF1059 domain-containing protein [Thermoplasmata archaeon]
MTAPERPTRWALACRDLGFACGWSLTAGSVVEVRNRFFEHAKCAHGMRDLPGEMASRVDSAAQPA